MLKPKYLGMNEAKDSLFLASSWPKHTFHLQSMKSSSLNCVEKHLKTVTESPITTAQSPLAPMPLNPVLLSKDAPKTGESPKLGQQTALTGWTVITELYSLASPTLRTIRAKEFPGSYLGCQSCLISHRDKVVVQLPAKSFPWGTFAKRKRKNEKRKPSILSVQQWATTCN